MPTSFCRDANSYTQQYPVHLTASHERGYESRGWDAKAPAGSALSHLGGARSATAHPRELRFRPQWVQSRQLSKVHGMSASTTAPDLSLRRSEPAVWAKTGRERLQQSKPSYSISSSARTRSDNGTSSPSAFADLRLTKSSTLLGNSTGRSAGLVPLITYPTVQSGFIPGNCRPSQSGGSDT